MLCYSIGFEEKACIFRSRKFTCMCNVSSNIISQSQIEITVTDNSQSNLDCYNPPPLPVNLPLESPISRSSKPVCSLSYSV